jgi:hypothetical protein
MRFRKRGVKRRYEFNTPPRKGRLFYRRTPSERLASDRASLVIDELRHRLAGGRPTAFGAIQANGFTYILSTCISSLCLSSWDSPLIPSISNKPPVTWLRSSSASSGDSFFGSSLMWAP